MNAYTWDEVNELNKLLKRKEHKFAAIGFKGFMKKERRNDMGYPEYVEQKDGNWFVGFGYAMRITFIAFIFFMSGCFISKHCHADTASWYGTTGDHTDPWKHTTTANGEHFNEKALTAASWKYAIGSTVKVTNLKNNKSVIVRINDRGPGKRLVKKGRIIDLTRGSFAKIADLRDGVIPIKTTLIRI